MKVTIKGTEKEIAFNEYTRAIDKGFKKILYKDFTIGVGQDMASSQFNPMVLEEANDYLVKSLTNLTDEDLNNISNADFMAVLEECKNLQNPPQKAKNS